MGRLGLCELAGIMRVWRHLWAGVFVVSLNVNTISVGGWVFLAIVMRNNQIGFNSIILPWVYPARIVAIDPDGSIHRNRKGRAVPCNVGESGELVGKVQRFHALRRFDGYIGEGKKAAKRGGKKLVCGLFRPTDTYFRTGDLVRMDEEGNVFFIDRMGDTFRWCGENVSTVQVEGVMSKVLSADESVVVYGVEVPNYDGRAGMAMIYCGSHRSRRGVLMRDVEAAVASELPSHAWPRFIRIGDPEDADVTATFKSRKRTLMSDGLHGAGDVVYAMTSRNSKPVYTEMTERLEASIRCGDIRL